MQIECWRGYPKCVNILLLGCLLQQTAHMPCCRSWQLVRCCRAAGSSAEAARMDTTACITRGEEIEGKGLLEQVCMELQEHPPVCSLTEQVKLSSAPTRIQYLSPSQTPLAKCCLPQAFLFCLIPGLVPYFKPGAPFSIHFCNIFAHFLQSVVFTVKQR